MLFIIYSRKCFVTCEEMCCAKAFQNEIIRTFSAKGGVLWEFVTDKQLCQYLMSVTERFYNTTGCIKKAALIIGRQPGSEIYVLGDKLQTPRAHSRHLGPSQ